MADLAASSLTSRPVPSTDAAGRVVGRASATSDNAAPQQQHQGETLGQQTAGEDSARGGHHDPAVTLAATLAHVDVGAVLSATLLAADADGRVIMSAQSVVYLVEAPAQIQGILQESQSAVLRITAVDRIISADVIALDDAPLPAPLPVTLVVLKADPALHAEQTPMPSPTAVATYKPAPIFNSAQDTQEYIIPAAATAVAAMSAEAPLHAAPILPPPADAAPVQPTENVALPPPFRSVLIPQTLPDRRWHTGAASPPLQPVAVNVFVRPAAENPDRAAEPPHAGDTARPAQSAPLSVVTAAEVVALPAGDASNITAPAALRTAMGLIPLPADTNLPVGAQITVRLELLTASNFTMPQHHVNSALPTTASPSALPLISPLAGPPALAAWDDGMPTPLEPWPPLHALITATATDPAFSQALMTKLPSPQRPINPAFLLFLNLLGVSSPAKLLLGPGGEAWFERQGEEAALSRFAQGIERLKQIGADRVAGEWRPYFIPFANPHNPHGMESLLLLVRHTAAERDQDQPPTDNAPTDDPDSRVTRFVLDLRLSQLGNTQIDGIIQARTFNLAIRTEQPLPAAAGQDLRGIFAAALERNGFSGDLTCRAGLPFPVNSMAEWRAASRAGGTLSA